MRIHDEERSMDDEARSRIVQGEDPDRVRVLVVDCWLLVAGCWIGRGAEMRGGGCDAGEWTDRAAMLPRPSLGHDLRATCPVAHVGALLSVLQFYCPHPGCSRSFAELWRLKVHFRAPPDERGSGKERGHGTELKLCPKCGEELKPGKHHVGCAVSRGGGGERGGKRIWRAQAAW